jgi:protein TonB
MYLYQQQTSSRRLAGIGLVVAFHVVLIYALVTGLGSQVASLIHPPIQTKLIEEVKPPPPDEKLSPPPLATPPPPPYIPPPEIQVSQPAPQNAITAVSHDKPPEGPPAPLAAPEPVRVAPSVQVGKSCRIPEYPAASRLQGETGAVVLLFLVDVDGKVLQSRVESSSGHARLDNAAREALSLCHFTPGTSDGKPEQSWARLRYVWKIN